MRNNFAAVEKAAKAAGHDVKVPFTPRRMDASQEHSQFRALAEVYAQSDAKEKFVNDFFAPGPRS